MSKLIILYIFVMTLVGYSCVRFLVTSNATVSQYRKLCYEKYGPDHLKCAFVLPKE